MLFYDMAMFMIRKKEIDARLASLSLYYLPTKSEGRFSSEVHTSQTIWTWIDDCRFKFKKWQHKDIPSQPVTEQRMEIEGLLQQLEKEQAQSNKRIMEDVTSALWKKLKSSTLQSSSHQTDAPKCLKSSRRMSTILCSAQVQRKAMLKRKRALLIKQHKIDMEETRRCTEFLLRAKAIYCKQRFEYARKDERQKWLVRRAKAFAEAQSSGRTPELKPMAAPQLPLLPGMVRLGSQSSLTGLEQSGTPELKPMAAPRLPLLPGMRRGSQISLTGLVGSGSNPSLHNHPESSLAGAGLVRSGSPTLMGTMRRRSGSQSSTVSVGGKQKKQQATAEVNICNGAAECIVTADMPQRIFSLASDMSESKASIVGLLDHYGLLDESVLSGFGTYPRDRKHRKDGREETAGAGICYSPPRKPRTDAEISSESAISSRVRPSTPPRIPLTDAESWSRIRPSGLTPRNNGRGVMVSDSPIRPDTKEESEDSFRRAAQLETEYMTTNKLKDDRASRLNEMLRDSNETLHTPPSSWSRFR
jgi:hypothetical protein